jgi:magnesium-transporting ATPase (P-type)
MLTTASFFGFCRTCDKVSTLPSYNPTKQTNPPLPWRACEPCLQVDNVRNNLVHQLEILGRWLALMVLIVGFITLMLAHFRGGNPFSAAFASAVSVAVAIIPEGLPAMVTVVLAIGERSCAELHVLGKQRQLWRQCLVNAMVTVVLAVGARTA